MCVVVRPCRAPEVEALRTIEVAAGVRFLEVGMPEVTHSWTRSSSGLPGRG